jgi:hypothetical protein
MNDQEKVALYLKHGAFYDATTFGAPILYDMTKGVGGYPHLSKAFLKALVAIGGKPTILKARIRNS